MQVESWECDLKIPNLPSEADGTAHGAAAVLGKIVFFNIFK